MTNPPPDTLLRFMAELMEWTNISTEPVYRTLRPIKADHRLWGDPPTGKVQRRLLPNWPGDRNASGLLHIKDLGEYLKKANTMIPELWGSPGFDQPHHTVSYPAYIECLLWIFSEHGYKWVECETCDGTGGST